MAGVAHAGLATMVTLFARERSVDERCCFSVCRVMGEERLRRPPAALIVADAPSLGVTR
jgi:hypothetical protein